MATTFTKNNSFVTKLHQLASLNIDAELSITYVNKKLRMEMPQDSIVDIVSDVLENIEDQILKPQKTCDAILEPLIETAGHESTINSETDVVEPNLTSSLTTICQKIANDFKDLVAMFEALETNVSVIDNQIQIHKNEIAVIYNDAGITDENIATVACRITNVENYLQEQRYVNHSSTLL